MKTTVSPCFSNGTEFMMWQDRNCCNCVKAVWYNEKKDHYPQYRCSIQRDIEGQAAGLYEINQKSYDVTRNAICPNLSTQRKVYKKRIGIGNLFGDIQND